MNLPSPTPKQLEFLYSQANEALYGGAASGGKTEALLILAILRRLKYPGTHGIYFRRTLPELERGDGPIPRFRAMTAGIAKWSERKHRAEFNNGSVQEFGYSESEGDVHKYQGGEWQDVEIDETTHFTEFQANFFRSRLRGDGTVKAILRMASNPGNVGHGWVKASFIDPTGDETGQTGGEWVHTLDDGSSITRAFIPAKVNDNPHIDQVAYTKQLQMLSKEQREQLLDGRWDVFKGRFFKEFSTERNVQERKLEMHWRVLLGADYGYAAPTCALWGAVDEVGRVHIFNEFYQAGLTDERQAEEILRRGGGGRLMYCDPAIFAKRGETGRSIADIWTEKKLTVLRADNNRVSGWARLRSLIGRDYDGIPGLTIHPRCKNLIRTLPQLVHDNKRVEDLNTHQEDHACDALRYLLTGVAEVAVVPEPFEMGGTAEIVAKLAGLKYNSARDFGDAVRQLTSENAAE